jgi:hypothetical protein
VRFEWPAGNWRTETEPDAAPPAADPAAAPGEPAPAFRRALEVGDQIGLDESGGLRTDFCRGCGAENPEGARSCFSCGGALGGPDQEAFDARMREARLARQRASAPQATPREAPQQPVASPHPRGEARPLPPETDAMLEQVLREAEARHEPGFGAILAAGVLLAALFALVWIPVHTALALGGGSSRGGRGLLELGLAAVGALWVRRRFRRELDGL